MLYWVKKTPEIIMLFFTLYLIKQLLVQFVTRPKKHFSELSYAMLWCVMKEKEKNGMGSLKLGQFPIHSISPFV